MFLEIGVEVKHFSSADSELHGLGFPAPKNLLHSSVGYTWLAQPSAVFNKRHFPHRLKKNHSVLFSVIQEPRLKQILFPTAFPCLLKCTEVITCAMKTHTDSLELHVEGCTLLLEILSQGTITRLPSSAGSCTD